MHIAQKGHTYSWEWPEQNDLWKMARVADLLERTGAMTCVVSSAATGLVFEAVRNGFLEHHYLRNTWRIETTRATLPSLLKPFEVTPANIPANQFVQCRGKIGTQSAFYPPRLAKAVWQALAPFPMRRWLPTLVTRKVQVISKEVHSPAPLQGSEEFREQLLAVRKHIGDSSMRLAHVLQTEGCNVRTRWKDSCSSGNDLSP